MGVLPILVGLPKPEWFSRWAHLVGWGLAGGGVECNAQSNSRRPQL